MGSNGMPQMDEIAMGGKGFSALSELMRAIVLRAVEDYKAGGELREESVAYMTDPDEEYIFSFRFICKYLDIDPEKARHEITTTTRRISTRRRAA